VAERILTLLAYVLRRLAFPAAIGAAVALMASYLTKLLQRTREPAMPRMSDEWVRSHERDARPDEWGGLSW
jgi:hypothetical protein